VQTDGINASFAAVTDTNTLATLGLYGIKVHGIAEFGTQNTEQGNISVDGSSTAGGSLTFKGIGSSPGTCTANVSTAGTTLYLCGANVYVTTAGAMTASTFNGLTPAALSTGFSIAGGTTSKTFTVGANINTGTTDGTLGTGAFAPAYSLPATVVQTNAANTYTAGSKQTFQNSAAIAGFNLAPSAAPNTPVNGDCWTTTAGLYCYINGAVVGPYGAAGGTGFSGMTQYGFPVAASASTGTSSVQPASWTTGHTFVPVWQPSGSALAPIVVDANTMTVSAAATATSATTAGTLTTALAANQLLGSLTAVAPTGQSVPSCSTASSALLWTSGTGFSCNTSITANTAATATSATTAATATNLSGGTVAATTITGTSSATLGTNGGTGGSVVLNGSTSGNSTINVSATGVLQLPSGTTLTAPVLGTPASGVITNLTGTCTSCVANSINTAVNLAASGAGGVTGVLPSANMAAATPTAAGAVIAVANTTLTVSTSTTVSGNACNGPYTVSMTGVATTMTFNLTATTDTHAVTGWGAPAAGVLYITDWPTSGTFNYYVCNNTASSITTGGAVTFNISAR
jgi:hypothetical protein